MRVIAIQDGFHLTRIRAGKEFEYDLERYGKKDKEGNPVLPSWVIPASERSKYTDPKQAEADKNLAAVKAAAGPKRPGTPGVKVVLDGSELV